MSINQIQAIETNIKASRKLVEAGEALERLKGNRDFKQIIMDGYFEEEAIRLVHAKGNPAMQSAEMQKSILTQIDSISNLNMFFSTIGQQASLARKTIEQDEATRDEILAEDA